MDSGQLANLGRPGKVQTVRDDHVTKVDAEVVAPHREPSDVPQGFALGQRQGDVLVAVLAEDAGATAFVPQPVGALVAGGARVADVEVGRWK